MSNTGLILVVHSLALPTKYISIIRDIFDHRALLGGILYFEDWTGLDLQKKKNKDVRRSLT